MFVYMDKGTQTDVSFTRVNWKKYEQFLTTQGELNFALKKVQFSKQMSSMIASNEKSHYIRDERVKDLLKNNAKLFDKIDQDKVLYKNRFDLNLYDQDFPVLKARELLTNYCYEAKRAMEYLREKRHYQEENRFFDKACKKLKQCICKLDLKYTE